MEMIKGCQGLLPTPKLSVGDGALRSLVPLIKDLGIGRVLVVTGQELVECGVYSYLSDVLSSVKDLNSYCFAEVKPDPSVELVQSLVDYGRELKVEMVIALGGGSPIDAAKIAAALIPEERSVRDLIAGGKICSTLPLLAIPCTAGTGSEATPVAVLTDPVDQVKKGIVSEALIPRWAILDARLTKSLPQMQTAYTGLDALSHAIEAFNSKNASILSDFYAKAAIELIRENLRQAFSNGHDLGARTGMQLAAYYAGIAFANAGVTAAHAFAYPLGARYHFPHGLAVALMLPAVLEYNQLGNEARFDELAQLLSGSPKARAKDLVPCLLELCRDLGVSPGLEQYKVEAGDLPLMAESVLGITRILNNNPRPITELREARNILERAFRKLAP